MAHIDYMKVIDLVTKSFGAVEHEMEASHDKVDIFKINMPRIHKSFRVLLHKHEIEIIFSKEYFSDKDFGKWLSRFEYDMEQMFFVNIKIQTSHDSINFRVKIER